jgi:hypothetical protein
MKHLNTALALALSLICASAADTVTMKKGICLGKAGGGIRDVEKRIESLNVGWHYNWTPKWDGKKIKDAPFVPMIWANNQWAGPAVKGLKVAKSKADANPLLGYNEPDGKDQANMTVQAALDFWPELEKTNRRLGSPATVHADNEWMKAFMKGADEKGYRVDFVCVHWYGQNDPGKFIERLEAIHKLYGKPIWITEFAIADWSAKSRKDNKQSPRDVLRFMKAVLPKLERLRFVERYAWFHANPDHPKLGPSALFDEQGNLTELGEFYSSFSK